MNDAINSREQSDNSDRRRIVVLERETADLRFSDEALEDRIDAERSTGLKTLEDLNETVARVQRIVDRHQAQSKKEHE